MEIVSPESQFQVFRRRPTARRRTGRLRGRRHRAVVRRPEPGADHGAASAVGMGRFALGKATDYVKTRQVKDTHRRAPGLSHPLAAKPSRSGLAKLMMQKAATLYDSGDDFGAAEAANMAKYAAGKPQCARSTGRAVARRQRADQGVRGRLDADRIAVDPDRSPSAAR